MAAKAMFIFLAVSQARRKCTAWGSAGVQAERLAAPLARCAVGWGLVGRWVARRRPCFMSLQAALLAAAAPAAAARGLSQAAAPAAQPADGSTPVAFFGSGFLIPYYVRAAWPGQPCLNLRVTRLGRRAADALERMRRLPLPRRASPPCPRPHACRAA